MRCAARGGLGGVLGLALAIASAQAQQPRRAPAQPAGPVLSASRSVMAGSMLNVFVSRPPSGARLAITRPADPASTAIVVVDLEQRLSASLPVPGNAGAYELRLTRDENGAPVILLRQPLATTEPSATLAAPARVARGKNMPVRGIGPNGEQDRVVLVERQAAIEATGTSFFPAQNVEAMLEAPATQGDYELRYVMNAPISGRRILARRPVVVE